MKLYWSKYDIPHGYLCEIPIHLIYRVKDCLPVGPLRRLTADYKLELDDIRRQTKAGSARRERLRPVMEAYLLAYDELLDAQDTSRYILQDESSATAVIESWLHLQEAGSCVIYAICVMGNHVHVLLAGFPGVAPVQIGSVVRRHKSFTDKIIGKGFEESGQVWARGFFDRYMRPGDFERVLQYILDNPVKAGLVSDWRDWPATWVSPAYAPVL